MSLPVGNVLDWGAGCLNVQKYNNDVLARNGWIRSRYFKCKILTTDGEQGDLASLSRLPAGITPVTAWGLYLKELHKSAIEQIVAKRGSSIFERCKASGKLQYVITWVLGATMACFAEIRTANAHGSCPVQWRQDGLLILEQLREQAVLAGLVTDPYDERLTFLPESEASALCELLRASVMLALCQAPIETSLSCGATDCYRNLKATLQPGMVFTVVDAGGMWLEPCASFGGMRLSIMLALHAGGTVDMTVYQAISIKPTLQLKELKSPVGLFKGSVYIDEQFKMKIQDYLQG